MRLVFDIEADGFLEKATRTWCLVHQDLDTDEVKQWTKPERGDSFFRVGWRTAAKLEDMFGDADELIGHNIIGYDLPLVEKLYGWKPNPKTKITDTAILSRLLKSDRRLPPGCPGNVAPHSLEAWGYRVGRGKPDHTDWTQYSPEMLHRCTEDVEINILVYKELVREGRSTAVNWCDSRDTEHVSQRLIAQQEKNGVPLNEDNARLLKAELTVGIMDIDQELVPGIPEVPLPKAKQGTWPSKQFKKDGSPTVNALRYYGEGHTSYRTDIIIKTAPINLGSPAQVKDYLLTVGWQPTVWNYKKDPKTKKPIRTLDGEKIRTSPKLTEDSYDSISTDIGKDIALRLKMAHRLTVVDGLLDNLRADGRVSARAIAQGTPTGRMTHQGVVNIPKASEKVYLGRELRDLFTTVPGYTRVGIDLESCQLRGLCHYMGDPQYQAEVLKGRAHDYAGELLGMDKDAGKKFNFTTLFGGGVDQIANSLGISKEEAARLKALFFEKLPKLEQLIKRLEKEWKIKGYIVGLDGRALWVRKKNAVLVYLMQCLEAVVIKNFMINQSTVCAGLDYQLVTTMHDEVQYLVRDDHVSTFTTMAQWSIDRVNEKFDLQCPQGIDVLVGQTWADCH